MRGLRDETVLWQLHQSDREGRGEEEEEEQRREGGLTTVAQRRLSGVLYLLNFSLSHFLFWFLLLLESLPLLLSPPLPHLLKSALTCAVT